MATIMAAKGFIVKAHGACNFKHFMAVIFVRSQKARVFATAIHSHAYSNIFGQV
jgi:hypothetical protein